MSLSIQQDHIRNLLITRRYLKRVMERRNKPEVRFEIQAVEYAIELIKKQPEEFKNGMKYCDCIPKTTTYKLIANYICCDKCNRPMKPKEI